jgi:hypothetical protein
MSRADERVNRLDRPVMLLCAIYPTVLSRIYVHLCVLPPTIYLVPILDLTDPKQPPPQDTWRTCVVPTLDAAPTVGLGDGIKVTASVARSTPGR